MTVGTETDFLGQTPAVAKRWQVVAASATGVSHSRRGGGNEDAHLSASLLDGTLILAVSDGAGSARFAAQASQLAVHGIIEYLGCSSLPDSEAGWRRHLARGLKTIRSSFAATAGPGYRRRDYACTLLLVVLRPETLVALQIGDGCIVAQRGSEELIRLTRPFHGTYAGETTFVTSPRAPRRAQVTILPAGDISGLALMSDGLEPLAMNLATQVPHPPFFTPLFHFAALPDKSILQKCQELGAFLGSERINARTHDDKTLLLAVP